MSALDHLASLLRPAILEGSREMTPTSGIDVLLAQMTTLVKSNGRKLLSDDHQIEAVRRFWETQEISSFRDSYLLSWALCLRHDSSGQCLLEDQLRFQAVLDSVDSWLGHPNAYRRCYQGLLKSYFTYDNFGASASAAGKNNWKALREYLHDRNIQIRDKQNNPSWVDTAVANIQLFSRNPCEPYVDALLHGDVRVIEHLCEDLGIAKTSWFLRALVLAQIRGATKLSNFKFQELMPRLLQLLSGNEVLRDRGLVLILDRYAEIPGAQLHPELRDSSVLWWGNPWLPSNDTRWGAVAAEARAMVSDWLKLEFIETFFTKLAQDGLGDRRRMEFWKRYVNSIGNIEFALGAAARSANDPDFVVLRKKMKGLVRNLDASGVNNAFIMRMGDFVAVEFSGMGNAFYGYDAKKSLPFDTAEILKLAAEAHNSLKQKSKSILHMRHQDGIHGWEKWEQMFEATLRNEFGIEPEMPSTTKAASKFTASNITSSTSNIESDFPEEYTRAKLNKFASSQGLQVDDNTAQGGSLWVRIGPNDEYIKKTLLLWGFKYKADKGWWK